MLKMWSIPALKLGHRFVDWTAWQIVRIFLRRKSIGRY